METLPRTEARGITSQTGGKNREIYTVQFPKRESLIFQIRQKSKEWIEQLTDFKSFITDLNLPVTPSVKVAILDDGAKFADLEGELVGHSLLPNGQTYFVGPCKHGTEMALRIREICPNAELYIIRLDDSRIRENQEFTISSCVEVRGTSVHVRHDTHSPRHLTGH
jgi:hypothetical protein